MFTIRSGSGQPFYEAIWRKRPVVEASFIIGTFDEIVENSIIMQQLVI